jgi:hypothetical protein
MWGAADIVLDGVDDDVFVPAAAASVVSIDQALAVGWSRAATVACRWRG